MKPYIYYTYVINLHLTKIELITMYKTKTPEVLTFSLIKNVL